MLADQFTAAAGVAGNFAQLDEVSRLSWRAFAEGHLAEEAAQAISVAVQARRMVLKGRGAAQAISPPRARRRPASATSIARRRQLAGSGAVPGRIAAEFTLGETAALTVIAREVQRRGRCELAIDAIAAMAGTCRSVVQNALRHARRLGLVTVTERRRRGRKSDTNIVEVASPEWRLWLRLGGNRVQKRKHHEYQDIQECGKREKTSTTGWRCQAGPVIYGTCTTQISKPYLSER